ncbi:hypothetical protein, partial [Phaeovulum sp.]|uniref:hypothetical protein n=1 Tax=Phaeovulum sp. TaxID=2934796 RepID=UPI0027312330
AKAASQPPAIWRARLTGRRLVAHATPKSKVAGFCAALWPGFTPPLTTKSKVAGFYTARSRPIPPLPWPTFAPPFSKRDGDAEGGIEPPSQVHTGDVLRLDRETVAGGDVLADLQHLALHLLAEHRGQVSRWLGV